MSCFARQGVQATSMQDIFTQGGLSPSVVYRHYRSKQALIVAAAEHSAQALKTLLLPREPASAALDQTEFIKDILFRLNQRAVQPTLRNALALVAEAIGNPEVSARFLVMRRAILEALDKIQGSTKPENVSSQLLYALLLGAIVQKAMDPELDVTVLARSWKAQLSSNESKTPMAAVAQGWIRSATPK